MMSSINSKNFIKIKENDHKDRVEVRIKDPFSDDTVTLFFTKDQAKDLMGDLDRAINKI